MLEGIIFLSPLEQFVITTFSPFFLPLFSWNNRFYFATNFSWMLFLIISLQYLIFRVVGTTNIINQSRILFNSFYSFIVTILKENFTKKGFYFFSYIYFLFSFLLLANLFGMIPYSFAITSHLIVTLTLSFLTFFSAVFIGFFSHGLHFFELFLPQGAPFLLTPFLIVIELISFFARLFSLAIRLFANIMSGHTLLKILATFSWLLFINLSLLAAVPFFVILVITGLEMVIAALQAYVFTVLSAIYLNEALVLH